jgi:tetratricopeptide (TPR) repeat protein/tRNA A-37 threonylcarbamoyl transferase component Bud32
MSNWVGKQFGSYQIVALLGEGGMASVYRAQQTSIKREVAVKIIRTDLAENDSFVKRFEREAQTVAALSHPHILKIFEFGQYEGSPFLAMELLTGGSLAGFMRAGALPVETAARIMGQICGALDYAHSQGIVHRDLKPQNVMLDGAGNAILTDFGLAKLVADTNQQALTQTGTQLGTPAYMSPEQWRAEVVDARSDVYALGVMLFEMLTASPLYQGQTPYEMMHKHLFIPPPSIVQARADLPAALESVIQTALAKERADRYPSAGALFAAFQTALSPGASIVVAPQLHDPPTLAVSPSKAAAQEREAIARLEAERFARSSRASTPTGRLIGALPQDVSGRYVGRAKQVADITNLLLEKTRLVSIYGRGGVGKTALACKVLSDLQQVGPVDGIVALTAASGTVRLDRILTDFGRVLGGDERAMLEGLARDGDVTPAQKTGVLLEKLRGGRYILLLDNLETLQDEATGELTDPDLKAFIETTLEQGGDLHLLITSREPLAMPRALKTWERLIPLDEGLGEEDAVLLLRAFDPDGTAGLRDAPDDQLLEIARKTGSYPRALEAVAGMLLEDPLLSLDDLLRETDLLSEEITQVLVQQAIARLSPDAVRVMQALALFGRPVNQTALEFLLAPYMEVAGLRNILARLVRTYFAAFNKANGQFALHPLDRVHCYETIPAEGAFNRKLLHLRAADYYRHQRKPQAAWHTIDDLMPQLAEFDHWVAAADYDEAIRLLLTIDRDYLWDWGQRPLLEDLHKRLSGKITDKRLAHQNARRLTWMRFFFELDEVIPQFEAQLANARLLGDRQLEADALDDLAQTRRGKMDIMGGYQFHQQALEIYREIGDRRGQAEALGGMGSCLMYSASDSAVPFLLEAVEIQRDLGNQHSLSYLYWALGSVYIGLGQLEQAIDYNQQAVNLGRAINSSQSHIMGLVGLGQAYGYLDIPDKALEYCEQAYSLAREMSGGEYTYSMVMAGTYNAIIYGIAGNLSAGITLVRQLLLAKGSSFIMLNVIAKHILALMLAWNGEDKEANELIQSILTGPILPLFKVQQGVILAVGEQNEMARNIFEESLAFAQTMTPTYQILYIRGLSLSGLGLLNHNPAQVQAGAESYRQARAACDAPGYRRLERALCETLMRCPDGDMLEPARAALLE